MSLRISATEEKALIQGCKDPNGKFSVARHSTLTNLVALRLAKRADVEGPPGSKPEPARYNGIITEDGRAAVARKVSK
jgi:hypothetical protein